MKRKVGIALFVIGIILGLYVGVWLLFFKPILACYGAFDEGTLTAMKIGVTVVKCLFAGPVGTLIVYIGFTGNVLFGQ